MREHGFGQEDGFSRGKIEIFFVRWKMREKIGSDGNFFFFSFLDDLGKIRMALIL